MIFNAGDREAVSGHNCTIHRFPKSLFEAFPNGEYGSASNVTAEARLSCSDCVKLLKAFGYQTLYVEDLEKLVRLLLREDVPFESEGFEALVLTHRESQNTTARVGVGELAPTTGRNAMASTDTDTDADAGDAGPTPGTQA
jgi:hypothetical protein